MWWWKFKIIVCDRAINDISSTLNCISANYQTKDERLVRSISANVCAEKDQSELSFSSCTVLCKAEV